MSSFVERFSELRAIRNMSYSAIAENIGVSLRAMKYYGSGERQPTLPVLLALADFFDVSLDYLCGRSNDPSRH